MKLKITIEGDYISKLFVAQLIQNVMLQIKSLSTSVIVDEYVVGVNKALATRPEVPVIIIKMPEVITPMSKEEVDQYFEGQVYIENHANEAYIKMGKYGGIAAPINETKLLDQLIAADENNVKLAEAVIKDQQYQLIQYKARLEALKLKRGH